MFAPAFYTGGHAGCNVAVLQMCDLFM